MKINVYLSDLGAYTSGNENGRWIPLPMDETELKAVYNSIVKDEEIILDYNAPFTISEFENVFELNAKMQAIADEDETTIKALFEYCDTAEEAIKALESGNYNILDIETETDGWNASGDEANGLILHYNGFNDLFGEVPENMIDFIKWADVWECLSINQGWREIRVDDNYYLVTVWN